MHLELDPADIAFRDELREWLQDHADPSIDEREWHRRLVAGRWVVPAWPQRWGGRDATLTQEILYNQELAVVDAPVPRNAIGLFNIGPMLLTAGTPDQQERYLPPMVDATEIWCQGFSEPGAGSDLAALGTRAVDAGDHWVVNGQKVWTTFADEADLCLALVRTDPEALKHRGISALIIDMHAAGVEVRPLREITGDDGFNEIFFTDVRVAKDALVGPLHGGWGVAMSTLMHERLGTMKLGVQLRRRLADVVELARKLGRGDDQDIRSRLAELAAKVELMEVLTGQALGALQRGLDPGAALPLGKLQWSELMQELAELALLIEGPHALLGRGSPGEPPGEWTHHALYSRMTTIGAGTTQVQKNILAYRSLGLPRSADANAGPAFLDPPLDEELAAMRGTARRFLADRAPTSWLRERIDADGRVTPELWAGLADLGLLGLLAPVDVGGTGLGLPAFGALVEEFGRALLPEPIWSSAVLAMSYLTCVDPGHDLVASIARGEATATVAFPVPTAEPPTVSDGRLVGAARFVPDPAPDRHLLVVATEEGRPGLYRVTDRSTVGTEALVPVDLTRPLGNLVFDRSPVSRIGGDAPHGSALERADRLRRALAIVDTVGAATRALEMATEYAKVRVQFDQPIGSFQAVQHLLADALRNIELSRAGALAVLESIDAGDDEGAHALLLAVEGYAPSALYRVTADAIQVLGGIGFTWEHDAHLYHRRAMALQAWTADGTRARRDHADLLLSRT